MRLLFSPVEDHEQPDSQKRVVKIALESRAREFVGQGSRLGRWLRETDEVAKLSVDGAEYALSVSRRVVYGIVLMVAVLATLFGFVPHLRHFIWPGMAWAILAMSLALVLGLGLNILFAVSSMYLGYRPRTGAPEAAANAPTGMPEGVLRFEWRVSKDSDPAVQANRLEESLAELCLAECALSNLVGSDAFQAFTDKRKHECYQAVGQVQSLIQEISTEISPKRVAS